MPSHDGSYDEEGDPDNFLHLFEGSIRMQNGQCPQQKKFTKTHLAVHIIKQKEGESTRAFVTSLVEFLSIDLPTSYKGLMEKTYTWIEAKEVTTNGTLNDRRENSNRFKRDSSWDNNRGKRNRDSDRKKENKETVPAEAPILMLSRQDRTHKRKLAEEHVNGLEEITFPPVSSTSNFSNHVIINAWTSGGELNRVYMDSGSSGALLAPGSLTRTEVLNFVIIRSNSPHKLLLRRTAMQRMGIVVSTVHRAINFYTPNEIGTVLSTCEPPEKDKGKKKSKATCSETVKNVLSCVDIEERIIVNTKYPEKTVAIGKQLPTNIKERLQKLLIANADVFAWTYTDMKRIPKTIIVGRKPFNTEHKLNEYKHIKPIKQKRRGLGSDCSEATEMWKNL
uniref:Reverse transcriptase domain-containing protein n=1 Tax=Tanacetum cinerariifolium TaxID=118510 RepID=A0A699HSP9_TANCI|nr:hypothetical protein [Tanacetum cinerariifolium]